MTTEAKILRSSLRDLTRSRWVGGYLLCLVLFVEALYRVEGSSLRVLINLVDVVLLLVPLASAVFGTVYVYGSRDYIELLLSQPVSRRQLFTGLYLALALALSGAFVGGAVVPFLVHGVDAPGAWGTLAAICGAGLVLTWISVALAFLVAIRVEDRMKGMALVILTWLALAVVYDGALLLALNAFSDYPVEHGLLAATLANPVDLARVLLLLRFDAAALMGYTGEVFNRFFASAVGMGCAAAAAALWLTLPLVLGARAFRRKDF